MKVLIIGGTGLLGRHLSATAQRRGWDVVRIGSRSGDIVCDICNLDELEFLLNDVNPDVLINAAALVNLAMCENDPGLAWKINARPVSHMAEWSQEKNRKFLHVSTDHFFSGDGPTSHCESDKVILVNEYARTKFSAEALALINPKSLIVRTTFVGRKANNEQGSFFDWVWDCLTKNKPMTLFSDAFFSPIAVADLATAMLDIVGKDICGVLNVAGRDVVSKEQFIRAVAAYTEQPLNKPVVGSITSLSPIRGDSLGLDVTKAESVLGRMLPDLNQTIRALFSDKSL